MKALFHRAVDRRQFLISRFYVLKQRVSNGAQILFGCEANRFELTRGHLVRADGTIRFYRNLFTIYDYIPAFTCHGFRYAEVSGAPGGLRPEQITAVRVYLSPCAVCMTKKPSP